MSELVGWAPIYVEHRGEGGEAAEPVRAETPELTRLEVPRRTGELPDGREVEIIGDIERWASLHHQQGENQRGFWNTGGLVACEEVLRRFGLQTTEDALLERALAEGRCDAFSDCRTSLADQAALLNECGIPARVERHTTLDGLAEHVENGQAVIMKMHSGMLLESILSMERTVVVTGVARHPDTGEILGVFINDPFTGAAGEFVDRDTMEAAYRDLVPWVVTGVEEPRLSPPAVAQWGADGWWYPEGSSLPDPYWGNWWVPGSV